MLWPERGQRGVGGRDAGAAARRAAAGRAGGALPGPADAGEQPGASRFPKRRQATVVDALHNPRARAVTPLALPSLLYPHRAEYRTLHRSCSGRTVQQWPWSAVRQQCPSFHVCHTVSEAKATSAVACPRLILTCTPVNCRRYPMYSGALLRWTTILAAGFGQLQSPDSRSWRRTARRSISATRPGRSLSSTGSQVRVPSPCCLSSHSIAVRVQHSSTRSLEAV